MQEIDCKTQEIKKVEQSLYARSSRNVQLNIQQLFKTVEKEPYKKRAKCDKVTKPTHVSALKIY